MADYMLDNPTEELVNIINTESTSIQRRLEEIQQQIEQYEQMVRRQENQASDSAAALKTIRDNYTSIPREDILARYDEALDARFRLATMRGQLEQFKSTKEFINEERKLLNEILSRVQGGIEIQHEADEAVGLNNLSVNIVRIIQAQEDERRRLANQMHDGPAQSLTNFVLQAEICQRLFDRNPETAREELINLKEAASITFQRVRDFISDLRPMMLDDLGVIPTVRRYLENFSNKSDIVVKNDIAGKEDRRLQEYQEVMIFRGIQELIAHARDFADATQIQVRLDIQNTKAVVVVEDNGRTFNTEALLGNEQPDDPRTQGFQTLREKFELIGGTISVTSDEGQGTQCRFEMAIQDRNAK